MEKPRSYLNMAAMLFLAAFSAQAQKGQLKTVVDAATKFPVDYVSVRSDNKSIALMSNKDGRFILFNDPNIKYFSFYKMGYEGQVINADLLSATDTIFLKEKQFNLDEVVIKGRKLDTVVKDKRFYVDDYFVLPNADFLIITSKINIPGSEVCYYSRENGISQVKKIKAEQNAHFVSDCFKNIHVVTDNFSRQIFFDSNNTFEFLPKYTRAVFDSTLVPCALKIDTAVIWKHMLPPTRVDFTYTYTKINAPSFSYYRVSKHRRDLFCIVSYNEHMREMMEHEIEDTFNSARNQFTAENLIDIFFSRIATPLYAPLYLKNDTVLMFDFQQHNIVFLTKTGKIIKLVKLDEGNFSTIHSFEVLQDPITQKFYMKMTEGDKPQLKQLNIYSGKAVRTVNLEKTFARNIRIVNDKIYFLVKEREWDDTRYLYQQN